MNTNSAAEFRIKFRFVELKTPRCSTAIGSNRYAEDRVEYFSVFLVAATSDTVPASGAALSTYRKQLMG